MFWPYKAGLTHLSKSKGLHAVLQESPLVSEQKVNQHIAQCCKLAQPIIIPVSRNDHSLIPPQ